MPRHYALLAATALFWAAAASADTYRFGGRYFEIPAPDGFVAASATVPGQIDVYQSPLQGQLRVSDVWFPQEDVKAMLAGRELKNGRTFQLRTVPFQEGVAFTTRQFVANLPALEQAIEQPYREAGAPEGARYDGVFQRGDWRLFVTTRSQKRDRDGNVTNLVNAIGVVLVNYQVLSLQVTSPSRTEADAQWARAALEDWAWDISFANPSDPKLRQAERDAARGWSIRQVDIRLLSTVLMFAAALTAWWRLGRNRGDRTRPRR